MKAVIALVLFALTVSSHAQVLTLNPGESYSYHLTSMVFAVRQQGATPKASCSAIIQNFPAGSGLLCELWEGEIQGPPLQSKILNDSDSALTVFGNVWSDLEGFIRLTALTNTVTIYGLDFSATVKCCGDLNSFNIYVNKVDLKPLPPQLSIFRGNNAVQLSWWSNVSAGYVLESSNLKSTNSSEWVVVTQASSVVTGRNVVTLSAPANTNQFFRLRK